MCAQISIIITTYNVEKYIIKALKSVVNQRINAIEIICIDNCSSDATVELIDRFRSDVPSIRFIKNETNRGISYSRNLGIKEAHGEYFIFLDADDELLPNSLSRISDIVSKNPVDILFFDAMTNYENRELKSQFGNYKAYREKSLCNTNVKGVNLFEVFVKNDEYTDVLWRQCFRRRYVLDKGIKFYGYFHEDVVFSFKAILQAESVLCVREQFYLYNRRGHSLTTQKNEVETFIAEFSNYCTMLDFSIRMIFSRNTSEAINVYLTNYLRHIHFKYRYTKGLKKLKFDDFLRMHLFASFLLNRNIMAEHILEMEQYENIIIYGAGYMAKRLLNEFYDKRIIGIAVSDTSVNPSTLLGFEVRPLTEYCRLKETAVVIVAVVGEKQKDIIANLKVHGFSNYICL